MNMKKPKTTIMDCKKCGSKMKPGKALINSLQAGIGKTIHTPGATLSYSGPPKLVKVMKCTNCGRSVLPKKKIQPTT